MSRSIRMELPSLAKEGWLRPLRKSGEASLVGADGVVRSSHRLSEVERTTPFLDVSLYRAHASRRAFQRNGAIYLMARPPLLCQGGEFHSDASRHLRFIVFSPTRQFCLPRSGGLKLRANEHPNPSSWNKNRKPCTNG